MGTHLHCFSLTHTHTNIHFSPIPHSCLCVTRFPSCLLTHLPLSLGLTLPPPTVALASQCFLFTPSFGGESRRVGEAAMMGGSRGRCRCWQRRLWVMAGCSSSACGGRGCRGVGDWQAASRSHSSAQQGKGSSSKGGCRRSFCLLANELGICQP